MLLQNRRKKPDEQGRTDVPEGRAPLTFGSPLPDVQLQDPRLPLAEALAQIPEIGAKMAQGFAAQNAMEAKNPQAYGMEGPPAPGGEEAPTSGIPWLDILTRLARRNPSMGGPR